MRQLSFQGWIMMIHIHRDAFQKHRSYAAY